MRRRPTRATRACAFVKGPIQGIYLSIFLTVTLLILISATWLGLYLAKRITRPVQMLAEGARAIGAGQLDVRLEPETGDELGSLVESFNMMAAELQTSREQARAVAAAISSRRTSKSTRGAATSRRFSSASPRASSRSTPPAASRRSTAQPSGCSASSTTAVGQPARDVFAREDLQPLLPLVDAVDGTGVERGVVQEITLAREGREVHLAAAATVLAGDDGSAEGAVLVLDDVTPLIRAQRVAAWRDVARRLAHEIKNPLTPIQLSAERLRRHFGGAPPPTSALVGECTDAIITEVEALKGLVDEFAQFARLRGPRLLPTDLNRLIDDTLQLYAGVLQQGTCASSGSCDPSAAARPDRRRADAPGHHQPRGQRDRGARRARGAAAAERRRPAHHRA